MGSDCERTHEEARGSFSQIAFHRQFRGSPESGGAARRPGRTAWRGRGSAGDRLG